MILLLYILFAQHDESGDKGEEHGAEVRIRDKESCQRFGDFAEVVAREDQLHDCEGEDYVGHVVFFLLVVQVVIL
jgi:hypothetical protein